MTNENQIKEMVKQKYAEIALQDKETASCSCFSGCCSDAPFSMMTEDYSQLDGYNPDADLGLGCGLPTQFAKIKKGDIVIDLGSGAGNDCFVARAETGETGSIIGIDFTEAMIEKAKNNAEKLGFSNVEFLLGDIENMPVKDNCADVVVSNCVLNLLPEKDKIFKEIFRVLKNGGHFCISDIVLSGELPANIKEAAEMYCGCVAGAIQIQKYLLEIQKANFVNVKIENQTQIVIPDEVLEKYMKTEELKSFKEGNTKVLSITVTGVKPEKSCDCSSGCC
jgi:ubiquinone/menaquinone biosynthesis C-methylase UbiE